MTKWATRFYSSFSNRPREQITQKYQNRPPNDIIKDVLMEITKYLDHLMGDEVAFH